MIKLSESDLDVLKRASEILTSLCYNSGDNEEEKLDIFSNTLWIDGIIINQEKMRKNGGK